MHTITGHRVRSPVYLEHGIEWKRIPAIRLKFTRASGKSFLAVELSAAEANALGQALIRHADSVMLGQGKGEADPATSNPEYIATNKQKKNNAKHRAFRLLNPTTDPKDNR